MNPLIEFVQQYAPLFGVLAAIATILGVAFTIYKTSHDRLVRDLREQLREKQHRIDTLEREGPEGLRVLNRQLQEQLEGANPFILSGESGRTVPIRHPTAPADTSSGRDQGEGPPGPNHTPSSKHPVGSRSGQA